MKTQKKGHKIIKYHSKKNIRGGASSINDRKKRIQDLLDNIKIQCDNNLSEYYKSHQYFLSLYHTYILLAQYVTVTHNSISSIISILHGEKYNIKQNDKLKKMYNVQREKMTEVNDIMNKITHNVLTSDIPVYQDSNSTPTTVPQVDSAPPDIDTTEVHQSQKSLYVKDPNDKQESFSGSKYRLTPKTVPRVDGSPEPGTTELPRPEKPLSVTDSNYDENNVDEHESFSASKSNIIPKTVPWVPGAPPEPSTTNTESDSNDTVTDYDFGSESDEDSISNMEESEGGAETLETSPGPGRGDILNYAHRQEENLRRDHPWIYGDMPVPPPTDPVLRQLENRYPEDTLERLKGNYKKLRR